MGQHKGRAKPSTRGTLPSGEESVPRTSCMILELPDFPRRAAGLGITNINTGKWPRSDALESILGRNLPRLSTSNAMTSSRNPPLSRRPISTSSTFCSIIPLVEIRILRVQYPASNGQPSIAASAFTQSSHLASTYTQSAGRRATLPDAWQGCLL
jgi:hypothetical protein